MPYGILLIIKIVSSKSRHSCILNTYRIAGDRAPSLIPMFNDTVLAHILNYLINHQIHVEIIRHFPFDVYAIRDRILL